MLTNKSPRKQRQKLDVMMCVVTYPQVHELYQSNTKDTELIDTFSQLNRYLLSLCKFKAGRFLFGKGNIIKVYF